MGRTSVRPGAYAKPSCGAVPEESAVHGLRTWPRCRVNCRGDWPPPGSRRAPALSVVDRRAPRHSLARQSTSGACGTSRRRGAERRRPSIPRRRWSCVGCIATCGTRCTSECCSRSSGGRSSHGHRPWQPTARRSPWHSTCSSSSWKSRCCARGSARATARIANRSPAGGRRFPPESGQTPATNGPTSSRRRPIPVEHTERRAGVREQRCCAPWRSDLRDSAPPCRSIRIGSGLIVRSWLPTGRPSDRDPEHEADTGRQAQSPERVPPHLMSALGLEVIQLGDAPSHRSLGGVDTVFDRVRRT